MEDNRAALLKGICDYLDATDKLRDCLVNAEPESKKEAALFRTLINVLQDARIPFEIIEFKNKAR